MSKGSVSQTEQHCADIGQRIAEHESDIARQSALIATLDIDGRVDEARQARSTLDAMLHRLEDLKKPEPLDEGSLEAVMRDCPL